MDSLEAVHIDADLKAEYEETTADLVDRNREGTASSDTIVLSIIDMKRDEAVSCVTHTIEAGMWSPVTESRVSAHRLETLVEPYKRIQTEAANSETLLIDGLLKDLRKEEFAKDISNLHLGGTLDALDTLNKQYRQEAEGRTDERLANQKETTKDVRRREDALYQRICDLIYASELLCADELKLPGILRLIGEINIIIDETNASFNRSKGQKNAK